MQHVMNNISRMTSLKSRYGLRRQENSSAVSLYIKEVRIRKLAQKYWGEIKEDFERTYRFHTGFDYEKSNDIRSVLLGTMEVKLNKLGEEMELHGPQAVWEFMKTRMEIKDGIVRNFGQFEKNEKN